MCDDIIQFYFTLNLSEKINVLEIRSNSQPDYIAKVYGNQQFFKFRSYQSANVNYSLLDEADLVIINGIDKIDPGLLAAIGKYQSRFGSLLLIPGVHPDLESYRPVVHLAALRALATSTMLELERPDFKNPFFENVFCHHDPIVYHKSRGQYDGEQRQSDDYHSTHCDHCP